METFFNPKAHSPSVYIPCWLLQVSNDELSHLAKLLYGRLAQWSSSKGIVHRSNNQLAEELGVKHGVIERGLKELRDIKLIATYQKDQGGVNYFKFLKHKWMDKEINPNLQYASVDKSTDTPPQKWGYPSSKMGIPLPKNEEPKIKEIKRNKSSAPESVDKSDPPFKSESTLYFLSDDFFPHEKNLEVLNKNAVRCGMTSNELLDKFFKIHKEKHKTRSKNWQKKFIEFCEAELPKKTYEDKTGKRTRYDGKPLY